MPRRRARKQQPGWKRWDGQIGTTTDGRSYEAQDITTTEKRLVKMPDPPSPERRKRRVKLKR